MIARSKKIIIICCLLLTSSGLLTPAWSAERDVSVAIVIDGDSTLHEKAVDGIKEIINTNGRSGLHYRVIDIKNPDSSNALENNDIDYAVAVGVKPTEFTLQQNPAYPVLYTLIPEKTYLEIVEERKLTDTYSPDDDYVIYLGQTPERILALIKAIMGNMRNIGTVAGEYSVHEAKTLKRVAKNEDIDLIVRQASKNDKIIDDIKHTLAETDVYLALYDPKALNRQNAKWLLYMAYKMKKPVIGFSSSYTNAGAVASIFSTPEQIGRQSGEWLIDMLEKRPVPHQQYPADFTVTTNPNIQRLLHLKNLSAEEVKSFIEGKEQRAGHD